MKEDIGPHELGLRDGAGYWALSFEAQLIDFEFDIKNEINFF